MLKEVRYTGATANTSDYDCPDGELSLCFNMVNDAGALKAMEAPVNKFTVPGGGRVVAVHKTTNSVNYIILQTGSVGVLAERLYWVAESNTSGTVSLTLLDTDTPISMFRDIAIIGNTLIVADGLGLHYYLWQDSAYKDLGKRPPFVTLEFGMMRCSSGGSVSVSVPSSVLGSYNGSSGRHEGATVSDEDIIKVTNTVIGQINKLVADATQKGMFTMPFFVRYAYRLFDGSHYWASAPILMLPITTVPILNAGTSSSAVVGNVKQFWLCYHALEDGITKLKGWSDIIKGIDVFVTRPIYTFDASANIGQAGYRSTWVNCITSSYALAKKAMEDYYGAWADSESAQSRSTDVGNVRPSRPGGSTAGGSMAGSDNITDSSGKFFVGAYSDYQNGVSAYSEKIETLSSTDRVWNLKSNENFITDLLTVHDFYLYARLNIDNLNVGDNLYECDGLHGRDLSNLLTRPTLDDDFNSHATLIPSVLYGFNSRLHMGDITVHPPTPFPLRSMKYCTGACTFNSGVNMAVFLRSGGESYEANNTANTGGLTNTFPPTSEDFPRFIYYPDASAYRMRLTVPDSLGLNGNYVLPLTSHDFLNGSYWFGGLGLTAKPGTSTEADPELPYTISRKNRVYYSEAGNPFVMRPANTAAVGNGRVLALCSATAPLSQGQFGQFPLYAFTDEGIWALEVTQTGTISSVRPGPRDVCTGSHGVQQLGGAVAFLSSQGLMILNGLQVQCISEIVDNDCNINIADVAPGLTVAHHSLSLPETIIAFKDYIKGARLAYDYTNRRLLCYNPSLSYSYIYSLSGNAWSMLDRTFRSTIPSYPETMLMSKSSEVLSLENSTEVMNKSLVITRPMGFDAKDVLKTVDTVIQRGAFERGSVKSLLYGSRDLFSWHLVWSSTDHFLRGFRGSPYKYFRLVLACSFSRKESLSGATVKFTPRMANRPR